MFSEIFPQWRHPRALLRVAAPRVEFLWISLLNETIKYIKLEMQHHHPATRMSTAPKIKEVQCLFLIRLAGTLSEKQRVSSRIFLKMPWPRRKPWPGRLLQLQLGLRHPLALRRVAAVLPRRRQSNHQGSKAG